MLEYCANTTEQVWKEISVATVFQEEQQGVKCTVEVDKPTNQHEEAEPADNQTMARYSIFFYYTADFEAATTDIDGFIEEVLAETNQGYKNSGVPLEAYKFCQQRASVNDILEAKKMLEEFTEMKGSTEALRGSADVAVLLVDNMDSCGIAWLNSLPVKQTMSVVKKSCAVGYYSFGHEVGHNIGLHHDPATDNNTDYNDGHGHLIAQGSAATGYRTILAYHAKGHGDRVNYYSNPGIKYPDTGTATGTPGRSNNAALLMRNRMRLAAIGDESGFCPN